MNILYFDTKGQAHDEKIEQLRQEIRKQQGCSIVLSALDEIAWLFNIRGSDIVFNPVFFSYAFVDADKNQTILYLENSQINEEVRKHLGTGIIIRPYQQIFSDLKLYGESMQDKVIELSQYT